MHRPTNWSNKDATIFTCKKKTCRYSNLDLCDTRAELYPIELASQLGGGL